MLLYCAQLSLAQVETVLLEVYTQSPLLHDGAPLENGSLVCVCGSQDDQPDTIGSLTNDVVIYREYLFQPPESQGTLYFAGAHFNLGDANYIYFMVLPAEHIELGEYEYYQSDLLPTYGSVFGVLMLEFPGGEYDELEPGELGDALDNFWGIFSLDADFAPSSNNAASFSWFAQSGVMYRAEWSTDLVSWSGWHSVTGMGDTISLYAVPSNEKAFYRVVKP